MTLETILGARYLPHIRFQTLTEWIRRIVPAAVCKNTEYIARNEVVVGTPGVAFPVSETGD